MALMNLNIDGVLTVEKVIVPADGILTLGHDLFRGERIIIAHNGVRATRGQDFIPDRIDERLYYQKNICLFTAIKILDESLLNEEIEVEYYACGDYINAEIWNEYPSSASLKQSLASKVDNSDFIKEVKRIDNDIYGESTARADADNALQDKINTETNLRIGEDEKLQTNINNEATARADADNALQDNINKEAAARESADNEIRNELSSETNLRLAGDAVLQEKIDAEMSTRAENDSSLQTQISDLKTKFESFVPGLTYKVVSSLPTADILNDVIYLVPADSTGSQNVYNEYLYIDGNWELIGTTATTQAITVDSALSATSTNPVQNKVINEALKNKKSVYVTLAELGLTSAATVDDVYSALKDGETAILATNEFTNQLTMFPNFCTNDQYAILQVEKKKGNRAFIEWRQKEGNAYAIAGLNSNNQFTNWGNIVRFKKDGYADDSIIAIGDTVSNDGVVQTLANLKFTTDIMTWDTGVYRVSHVEGLTNLPADITSTAPGFRLEHYDIKKWGGNHNPNKNTWALRHSVLYAENGNVYSRYTESGATAGVYTKDTGWRKINTNNSTTLVANTTNLKLDVTKKNASWYGAIKLTYLYNTSPVEVDIDFRSATDTLKWTVVNGQKYIKKITYTQDASNKAHYTIGVEFSGTTYGCYQAEVIGGFADINSLTADAFTGDTTAVYGNPWGKNNGVTLVSAPEDLGLTSPCTTVQLVQTMRNTFNKTITAGAIGVFNNGGKTITDAPSDHGLLHIEVFGHDRVLIRYDGIGGSTYAGSWIGRVKGSNGTFSEVSWRKIGDSQEITGYTVKNTSYYKDPGVVMNMWKKNGIAFINLQVQCVSPSASGRVFISGLPPSAISLYFEVQLNNDITKLHVSIDTSGNLSLSDGTQNNIYRVAFSYPIDD